MLKRPQIIGLSVAALVALVLVNLPSQTASRVKLAIGGLFLPLFGIGSSAQRASEAASMRVVPKSALISEVEKLREENTELRLQLQQFREAFRENEVLRAALGWQSKSPWKVRLARVITRDPANWWRTLQINLGSADGVTRNMPVVTSDGLAGRIDQVGLNYSRVVLLGDPQCRVAALVENDKRDTGIIAPGEATVLDESLVELTYLSRLSVVAPGQRVVTSGLGGIFPKGIPIGHVVDTNSIDYGLYLEARVKLIADLREMEEVWVLYP